MPAWRWAGAPGAARTAVTRSIKVRFIGNLEESCGTSRDDTSAVAGGEAWHVVTDRADGPVLDQEPEATLARKSSDRAGQVDDRDAE